MGWMYVLFAAIIEVIWVLGLRFSVNALEWTGTIIAIILSFYFIIKACEVLPSGTVYAVFTGSGAAVIVVIDMIFFQGNFSIFQLLFISLIIFGVIGIKLTSDEPSENNQDTVAGGR
ncbi:multidrug efflux SMR transporter [Cerasibacillus terrae]|uniref:Multidrug efflux SMR transporter n=1 Tax=Cerasibacillus terrae TaxID=2498845 RepID=A0A5C8NXL9_9BACI|nr:multidrug efflux SMR transporter [Cerasibacillus terrae]TXL65859.1 multidrug efflux SMR transporter [Cerasibacillus terrae]